MDLISRQAAIDAIANMEAVGYSPYATIGRLDALLVLRRIPSAERHGRWVKKYRGNFLCSKCGAWFRTTDEYGNIIDGEMTANYCESCGAKMDEVEENG